MNPYFEEPGAWEDFHAAYLQTLREALGIGLPKGYFVKTEQLVFLLEPSAEERGMTGPAKARSPRPATYVTGGPATGAGAATATPAVATGTAQLVFPDVVEEKHRFLEVRRVADRREGKVITVVEVLSPSNKRGGGRGEYEAKRAELLRDGTHLVEIDLLRGGRRTSVHPPPATDYCAVVARADRLPTVDYWAWNLRDPMPAIPVPLLPGDDDVPLDLQANLHTAHDRGAYAGWLYEKGTTRMDPPLPPDDAAWAEAIVSRRAGGGAGA